MPWIPTTSKKEGLQLGLLIAGILEALIALLLGLYLLSSSNVPHIFAGVAFVVGLVVLVLTLVLGRKSRSKASIPEDNGTKVEAPEALVPREEPMPALANDSSLALEEKLPASSLESPDDTKRPALGSTDRLLPATQSLLHDVVVRSRWRYRAREAETRAATLAELVLHEGHGDPVRDERPRQLRRLCDLAILSQGFEAWADGDEPSFRLERYMKAHSAEELDERLIELRREKEALEAEALRWGSDTLVDYDDPYRRSLGERMRFEKLRDLEERMEEIMLLEMGYDTMRGEEAP